MKFGQYELFGRIAVGGMAEVYRGRAIGEEGFEKPVAIKRILPHFAKDARFVSMLLTEARIHASLSHKNIVQIHDLGISEEGEYFIVLEYVDGRDLAALLDRLARAPAGRGGAQRLSDAVVLYIMIELGEGVHFAHELRGTDGQPLGLVHRDISPSNVLVSYAGEVKLSDFGLAKRRTDHSVVGSLKGKLAYMSPEQARRSQLDRRSDIFALGAVLFELLTGHRLREIVDEVSGWQQVASGLVPPVQRYRQDLPTPLERLLSGALAPNPRDRFTNVGGFVAAARAALEVVTRPGSGEGHELQEILRTMLPPGSPRATSEESKVIRLVSEFLPKDRTVLMGEQTMPLPSKKQTRSLAAPGLTPPPPSSPSVPRPLPTLGTSTSTQPPPMPVRETLSPVGSLRRSTPVGMPSSTTSSSHEAPAPPIPFPSTLSAPAALLTQPRRPTPLGTVHRKYPEPESSGARFVRALVLMLMLAVPMAGAAVHFAVVPLPVLAVWWQPARLDIASDPHGADVYLDGRRLSAATPTFVTVKRDRRTHVIELRKEGFQIAKHPVHYDRMEKLELTVTLQPESRPSFNPIPAPPHSAAQN